MEATIDILRPDGTSERHRIEGEQITIGRSSAAGISLPSYSDLEPEHVLVAPRQNGCWISSARGAAIAVHVGGRPFENGLIPWGSEFVIGDLIFRVVDAAAEKRAKKPGISPVVWLAFSVPLVAFLLLRKPHTEIASTEAEPPKLFAENVRCSEQGPNAAARARSEADAGFFKSDRYVFDLEDGVQAVDHFALAAACYAASGSEVDAARMRTEHDALAGRIDEDYAGYRLKLERAIRDGLFEDALLRVRALRRLTRHIQSDYTTWLESLEQQLRAILADRGGRVVQ
jgi:hypothetical protein